MASHTIAQFSDLHLTRNDELRPGVHPRQNLVEALSQLRESEVSAELLLFTGDLADSGESECYSDLRAIVEEYHGESDVLFLPGNHDDRANFRKYLLDLPAGEAPIHQSTVVGGGLRIVGLDSTVPGREGGLLGPEALAFLRETLSATAPEGTVVAVHHPPIRGPIQQMSAIRLQNHGDLASALDSGDACLVLCGHNHHASSGVVGKIPVWVSPAIAYRADVTSREKFRGIPGVAFSLIELDDEGFSTHVVPVPPAS